MDPHSLVTLWDQIAVAWTSLWLPFLVLALLALYAWAYKRARVCPICRARIKSRVDRGVKIYECKNGHYLDM